jgi:hypothetical protein
MSGLIAWREADASTVSVGAWENAR